MKIKTILNMENGEAIDWLMDNQDNYLLAEIDWTPVTLGDSVGVSNKKHLPRPLSTQSGGWFWCCLDGGVHGTSILPQWWSGEKFVNCNNKIITHFAKMTFPDEPRI